jgi:Domain of unknown function (DUF3859)
MDGSLSPALQTRWWLVALLALAFNAAAQTSPTRPRPPIEATLLAHGQMIVSQTEKDERGRPKIIYEARTPLLAEQGMSFGIHWSNKAVTGSQLTPMEFVVVHPPMTQPDGKITHEIRNKIFGNPINGIEPRHFGFKLEQPHELLAGDWAIQVYYDNKLLVEQKFVLVLK